MTLLPTSQFVLHVEPHPEPVRVRNARLGVERLICGGMPLRDHMPIRDEIESAVPLNGETSRVADLRSVQLGFEMNWHDGQFIEVDLGWHGPSATAARLGSCSAALDC